ncbi:heme exporter protein CcmD [Dokdonella ginsengisoli]|uniref:Heme exporter protein D n=1 Tax=Dokdonella ginsengisoli TaxID=363846 RepID=A0ABV9QY32_9GAMM
MNEFLSMGGYAGYVWPAYAVFFVVLAIEALAPRAQRRRVLAEIRGRIQRRTARDSGGAQP